MNYCEYFHTFTFSLKITKMALKLQKFLFARPLSFFGSKQTALTGLRNYRTGVKRQEIVVEDAKKHDELSRNVFNKVNEQIVNKSHGRLFAVVQILGLQYKITTEDILVIRLRWPPTIGDKIRLEKVLLVGSSDFTLIGRPILPLDQVTIYATVIEKTFTHPLPFAFYIPRSNVSKCTFSKDELTYLRITDINLTGKVNELGDTDGFKDRIF